MYYFCTAVSAAPLLCSCGTEVGLVSFDYDLQVLLLEVSVSLFSKVFGILGCGFHFPPVF